MTWPFSQLLELWKVARADRLFPADTQRAAYQPDDLAGRALGVAIHQLRLGCGETSNNCGPDVERYIAPARPPQNWCAAFVGWCYQEAARDLNVALPFARSLGAKRLGANVAAVGRRFTNPAEARPGDLVVFSRGKADSWMGHVGLFADITTTTELEPGDFCTIEGNHGPTVAAFIRNVKRDRFEFFASIRR